MRRTKFKGIVGTVSPGTALRDKETVSPEPAVTGPDPGTGSGPGKGGKKINRHPKRTRLPDTRPLDQRNKRVPYELLNGKVHHLTQKLKINNKKRFAV